MDLSDDDRALINLLQLAPRISWTDAATVLDRHPGTLAAHWQRLRTGGLAWITAHLLGDPDQMTLSFVDVDCELSRRQEVEDALCAIPEIVSVEESARNRDLVVTVVTPSWAAFTRTVLPQLAQIPGLVRYQSAVCTTLHLGADSWELDALSPQQRARFRKIQSRPPGAYAGPPPSAYWPIVQELSRNGRATATEIAQAAGLHPVTARRQLNRVLESGTLAFRCEVAQDYSGFPVSCQWFVDVPPDQRLRAAAVLRQIGQLRLCASTTGTSNFTFIMWLRSASHVTDIEADFLAAVPGAHIVESSLTIKFVKRVGWMLNADTTATGEVVAPRPPAG